MGVGLHQPSLQEAQAKERRIESQLKGLTGEEREAALRAILDREQQKRGFVSDEAFDLMRKKEAVYRERMAR